MQARLNRQEALHDEACRLYFLLTEQTLRTKRAADTVAVDQLWHTTDVIAPVKGCVDLTALTKVS